MPSCLDMEILTMSQNELSIVCKRHAKHLYSLKS